MNIRIFIIIDICIEDEEGGGGWIEGEGMLSSLISLRDDIISCDYRCLYLAWLKVSTDDVINDYGNVEAESEEPEVPSGLNELNGALAEFIDVFEINKDVIAASSEASAALKAKNIDYTYHIEKLTGKEKNEWLIRLINNEALLSEKLKRHFAGQIRDTGTKHTPARTVSDIVERALLLKEERKAKDEKVREEKRLAELKKIEANEGSLWEEVYSLIAQKKTKAYDEAVKILQSLKELAVYKNRFALYREKVESIKQQNSNLSGLKWRIDEKLLIE
jgi:hypothetical protein